MSIKVLYIDTDGEWSIKSQLNQGEILYSVSHIGYSRFHGTGVHHSGFGYWATRQRICIDCNMAIPQKIRTLLEFLLI